MAFPHFVAIWTSSWTSKWSTCPFATNFGNRTRFLSLPAENLFCSVQSFASWCIWELCRYESLSISLWYRHCICFSCGPPQANYEWQIGYIYSRGFSRSSFAPLAIFASILDRRSPCPTKTARSSWRFPGDKSGRRTQGPLVGTKPYPCCLVKCGFTAISLTVPHCSSSSIRKGESLPMTPALYSDIHVRYTWSTMISEELCWLFRIEWGNFTFIDGGKPQSFCVFWGRCSKPIEGQLQKPSPSAKYPALTQRYHLSSAVSSWCGNRSR
jgi:hypothetical protein